MVGAPALVVKRYNQIRTTSIRNSSHRDKTSSFPHLPTPHAYQLQRELST